MPGSNPLFGLNTLGGALSIQTKDGRNSPGTTVQAIYGSDVRRALEFEHGGSRASSGINWYVAGNLFAEDGWRDDSPSDVRQLFGKLGWGKGRSTMCRVSLAYADNSLNGNGLQEIGFLDRDYASVYTKPDETDNRSTFLNANATRVLSDRMTLSRQRLLPRYPHRHAQRRHQRGLARPVGLSTDARPNRLRCSRRDTSRLPTSRRQRRQHAFSISGAASPMCC